MRAEDRPWEDHPSESHPWEDRPVRAEGHPVRAEGHPSEGHPSEGHPSENHPSEDHPSEDHPSENRPLEDRPVRAEGHPSEGHPAMAGDRPMTVGDRPSEGRPTTAEDHPSEDRQGERVTRWAACLRRSRRSGAEGGRPAPDSTDSLARASCRAQERRRQAGSPGVAREGRPCPWARAPASSRATTDDRDPSARLDPGDRRPAEADRRRLGAEALAPRADRRSPRRSHRWEAGPRRRRHPRSCRPRRPWRRPCRPCRR
jgi:hypothetical protein